MKQKLPLENNHQQIFKGTMTAIMFTFNNYTGWVNGKETKPVFMMSTRNSVLKINNGHHFIEKWWIKMMEGHCIQIMGTINPVGTVIQSIYAPNLGIPSFIKSILLEWKTQANINPLLVGDFIHYPLDRSSVQKLSGSQRFLQKRLHSGTQNKLINPETFT